MANIEDRWNRGEVVVLRDLPLETLSKGIGIVLEEAWHYLTPCQVAGEVQGVEIVEGEVWFKLRATGTKQESLLRLLSGNPGLLLRVHRCSPGCGGEAVGDEVVHATKARLRGRVEDEEGWTANLEKVAPPEEPDDLAALREVDRRSAPVRPGALPKGGEKKEDEKKGEQAKEKEKKEKSKKKKKKKDKKKKSSRSSSSEGRGLRSGRRCKAAGIKKAQTLFEGTGLDASEKVRNRVTRLARKAMKKKGSLGSDSSASSSSSSNEMMEEGEENLFVQSSSVKLISDQFPGALASQGLNHMRSVLFQETGQEDQPGSLRPACLAYFRQVLGRKLQGPAQREVLTLCTCLDRLIQGRAASVADIIMQRLKSAESTANGGHWTVSQKMEVLPQEGAAIAGTEEISQAQKASYNEAKVKNLASFSDGKGRYGKGAGRGKDDRGDFREKGKSKGRGKEKGAKGNKEENKTA
eukprot:Skav223982  [mRNA]  locus=scaffold1107:399841:401238:- [translate_table: standard]